MKLEMNMNRTKMVGQQSKNWDFIKKRITSAKVASRFVIYIYKTSNFQISDALSVLKYRVNGKSVNVLRPIGEGGYSQVYEVYDKVRKLRVFTV